MKGGEKWWTAKLSSNSYVCREILFSLFAFVVLTTSHYMPCAHVESPHKQNDDDINHDDLGPYDMGILTPPIDVLGSSDNSSSKFWNTSCAKNLLH